MLAGINVKLLEYAQNSVRFGQFWSRPGGRLARMSMPRIASPSEIVAVKLEVLDVGLDGRKDEVGRHRPVLAALKMGVQACGAMRVADLLP